MDLEQEEVILDDLKIEMEYSEEEIVLSEVESEQEFVEEMIRARAYECAEERKLVRHFFCCVADCHNVCSVDDPPPERLSMFTLPADVDRRLQWLRLIDREDLLNSTSVHYVCEAHFYCTSLIVAGNTKHLQKLAIPILNLPMSGDQPAGLADPASQPRSRLAHQQCHVRPSVITEHTQTTVDLVHRMPIIKDLKEEITLLRREKKKWSTKKEELKLLCELCDKHMEKKFAELAKLHLRNRTTSSGNRYGVDFKKYCLRIYQASPKAFDILKEILPMPATKYVVMMRRKMDKKNTNEEKTCTEASSDEEDAR